MRKLPFKCIMGLHKWTRKEVCNTTVTSTDGKYFVAVFIHHECTKCGRQNVTTTIEPKGVRDYFEEIDGTIYDEEDV